MIRDLLFINHTSRPMTLLINDGISDRIAVTPSDLIVRIRPKSHGHWYADGFRLMEIEYPSNEVGKEYFNHLVRWYDERMAEFGDKFPVAILTRTAFETFCRLIDSRICEMFNFAIGCISTHPDIEHLRDSYGDLIGIRGLDIRFPREEVTND